MDANLKAHSSAAEAARRMVRQRYGRIINLASVGGRRNPGQANHAASKAGMIGRPRPWRGAGLPEHHGKRRGTRLHSRPI